jgi:hypothetical protein
MIAPAVNNPPSSVAWNPMIFVDSGKSNNIANGVRRTHMSTITSRHASAIPYIMYEFIIALMNANASGLLYISGVGGGNTPSNPKTGETSNKLTTTFRATSMYFFIYVYCNMIGVVCKEAPIKVSGIYILKPLLLEAMSTY